MLNSPPSDLEAAIALCELRRETLYRQLLGFEDDHHVVDPALAPQKRRVLELAVAHNPLAAAIFARRPLHCDHPVVAGLPFLGQPVTCFSVHEVLRRTRFHRDFADGCSPGELRLGADRVTHDQLLAWYQELIPNVNLHRVYGRSWFLENPAVAPVLAGVLTGALLAADAEPGQGLAVVEAAVLAAVACGLVLFALNRRKYGRQLTKTAPWNSSLYIDINLALLRERPEELHLACRARLPRPQIAGWKLKTRYYPLAQHVIDGSCVRALGADPGGA